MPLLARLSAPHALLLFCFCEPPAVLMQPALVVLGSVALAVIDNLNHSRIHYAAGRGAALTPCRGQAAGRVSFGVSRKHLILRRVPLRRGPLARLK